jgi:hypothetical protein
MWDHDREEGRRLDVCLCVYLCASLCLSLYLRAHAYDRERLLLRMLMRLRIRMDAGECAHVYADACGYHAGAWISVSVRLHVRVCIYV